MSKGNKRVLAIDNGKMNMKGKSEEKEIYYLNKYSEGHTDLRGENTYNVTYDEKNYTVGNNAKNSDKLEGKASEGHILCA